MTEPSEEQMQQALCHALYLEPQQVQTLAQLLPALQPWQAELVKALLEDRAQSKRQAEMLQCILESHWNFGNKTPAPARAPTERTLPVGYGYVQDLDTGKYYVYGEGGFALTAERLEWDSYEEAVAFACDQDRQTAPHRWRRIEDELCPDQTMLLFACDTWPSTTRSTDPVPVKTGYRNGTEYRIFGSSWTPTHWCYAPQPPAAMPAATGDSAAHEAGA